VYNDGSPVAGLDPVCEDVATRWKGDGDTFARVADGPAIDMVREEFLERVPQGLWRLKVRQRCIRGPPATVGTWPGHWLSGCLAAFERQCEK
jgi:hypothetical protein